MTTSPATTPEFGVAVLVSATSGVCWAATVVEPEPVTGWWFGSVPEAVAVFENDPASTSAWVTVYVAVQDIDACGARLAGAPGAQANGERSGIGSLIVMPSTVTVPVFWTSTV